MCRIASLLLLQRLEGSMSGDACGFDNMETRAVKFFFSARQGGEGNLRHSDRNIGDRAPSYATVKHRVAQFKRGDFSTCDVLRSERRKRMTSPEIIDQIHKLMGTAVAQWLRCCATKRKVAGSIPAGVIGFFIDIKSFRSHYGPGVDSDSNRNEYRENFLGIKAAGA